MPRAISQVAVVVCLNATTARTIIVDVHSVLIAGTLIGVVGAVVGIAVAPVFFCAVVLEAITRPADVGLELVAGSGVMVAAVGENDADYHDAGDDS